MAPFIPPEASDSGSLQNPETRFPGLHACLNRRASASSLLVLTPGLSHTALGIGLAILAAGLLGLVLKVDLPRWQHERDGPITWRLTHAAPGSLLATLAVIAASATITISIGGLYWLGGAMAVATSAGLVNSWVLLVEIKR
jgi:hypothetical protein